MTSPVSTSQNRSRIVFIDLLRIIACFFVIVNHTIADPIIKQAPSASWFVNVFYLFASKTAVPLFLMISGYTMLHRQESHKKTVTRLVRIAICLVLFSGVYYLNYYLTGQLHHVGIFYFVGRIIGRPITNAFWYLYMYMGILIMLPFLQKLCAAMEKRDYHIFFFWSFLLFSLWPMAVHFVPMVQYSSHFALPLFGSHLCMLFLGSYARQHLVPHRGKGLAAAALFLILCLPSTVLTWIEYGRTGGTDFLFFDNIAFFPILFGSLCLFYAASSLPVPDALGKIVSGLGQLTFGIFLVSDLLIEKLWFIYSALTAQGIPDLPAMLVLEISVFASGAAIVWLLRKIPSLRQLL